MSRYPNAILPYLYNNRKRSAKAFSAGTVCRTAALRRLFIEQNAQQMAVERLYVHVQFPCNRHFAAAKEELLPDVGVVRGKLVGG